MLHAIATLGELRPRSVPALQASAPSRWKQVLALRGGSSVVCSFRYPWVTGFMDFFFVFVLEFSFSSFGLFSLHECVC